MRALKWQYIQLFSILLVLLSFLTINGSVVSASTVEYNYSGENFVVNRYVNYSDTKMHDDLQDYLWTINNNFPNNFLPDENWRICAYNVLPKTDSSVFDDLNQSETAPNIHANICINGYAKTYATNKKGEIIVSGLDLAPGNSTYGIIEINDADNSWICNERHSRGTTGVITVGAVFLGINLPSNLVNPKHINGSLNIHNLCNGLKLDHLRLQIKVFDESGENVAEEDLPIIDELCPYQTRELTFEVSDGIKDLPEGKHIFKFYLYYGTPPKILTKTEAEITVQFIYGPYSIEIMKLGEIPWKVGSERREVVIQVINENPLREEPITVAYAIKKPDEVAIYNGSERQNLPSDGKYTLIINDEIDLSKPGNYTFNVLCLHRGQNVSTLIMAFNVKEEGDGVIRLLIWLIPSLIIAAVLLFLKIRGKQLHRPLN